MDKQHNAKFMGKVGKVRYEFSKWFSIYGMVYKELKDIEWELIEEVIFDNPPLRVGEKIYVMSLQKTVVVVEVIRSTDNSFIYYTDYVIEEIEDDETFKSKEDAEQQKRDYKEREFVQNKKPNEQEDVKEEQPKKKWYQFWR